MADFSFNTDEEGREFRENYDEVARDPDNFDVWEKLLRATETFEGGLHRNSSPQAIATAREIYDRFLARFPLLFGYWKKYADLEFSLAGSEAAELIYERGIGSIPNSVDLWANYCDFKLETSHDILSNRDLFERGASYVGLDFLAHPFWDKYLEFEKRTERPDNVFALLSYIIHIPMHQYARYFEQYRALAQTRPVVELLPADKLVQYRAEVEAKSGYIQVGASVVKKGELEIDRELRTRIDTYHMEIFTQTQAETNKRWAFESEIKRPYFHVTELDESQLANWRKYLDFEEGLGVAERTQFLYERCLVTCAFHEEFWFRYVRWMSAQEGKEEEIRNIFMRGSMLFVPISQPGFRLMWALFEEMSSRPDFASAIHEGILMTIPNNMETIKSWANLERRQKGLDAAADVYKKQLESQEVDASVKAECLTEWATLLAKFKGASEEARKIFVANSQWYLDSRAFWDGYLQFEIEQSTTAEDEEAQYKRVKQVHEDILKKSQLSLPIMKGLSQKYLAFILERGSKDAAKEYIALDREINGSYSVQTNLKAKMGDAGKPSENQLDNKVYRVDGRGPTSRIAYAKHS